MSDKTHARGSLDDLWERAKDVEMSDHERTEQRIIDVAANCNISDPRVTIETTRMVHELVEATKSAEH